MAGRPKRRARLMAEGKWPTARSSARSSSTTPSRKGGCSTAHYRPTEPTDRGDCSKKELARHLSTMPAFIADKAAHITDLPDRGNTIARAIITHCSNGKLETFVEDD